MTFEENVNYTLMRQGWGGKMWQERLAVDIRRRFDGHVRSVQGVMDTGIKTDNVLLRCNLMKWIQSFGLGLLQHSDEAEIKAREYPLTDQESNAA